MFISAKFDGTIYTKNIIIGGFIYNGKKTENNGRQ